MTTLSLSPVLSSKGTQNKLSRRAGGFSLVEVVLALGIFSFVTVVLMGAIPVGLTTLRSSMESTAEAQIVQGLLNDAYTTEAGTWSNSLSSEKLYDEAGQILPQNSDLWSYRVSMDMGSNTLLAVGSPPADTLRITIHSRGEPNNPTTHAAVLLQ